MDADPNPQSAEHDEPWPGGRVNHYLFDMNRDYFALSQRETQGRVKTMLEWYPQVVVDLHEMGGNSTYYFAPPADPFNPLITEAQRKGFDLFGRANAAEFDKRGFPYFVREVYDAFYPGYGDSWPMFHGAVAMTYEQASARGLAFQRDDGTVLTYKMAVTQHFTAAITTAVTAAKNRERLLRDFLDYRRGAIALGQKGPREYLIPPGTDAARAARLARLLAAQGVIVKQAEEAFTAGTQQMPRGTFVVPLAQPAGRLARNLLDPDIKMDEAFLKEQDRRRKARLNDQIYDVTAWSLPLMYDVEVVASDRVTTVKLRDVAPGEATPAAPAQAAGGYDRLPDALGIGCRDHRRRSAARRYPDDHRRRGVPPGRPAVLRSAPPSSASPATPRGRRRSCSRSRRSMAPSSCRSPRPGPTRGSRSAAAGPPR